MNTKALISIFAAIMFAFLLKGIHVVNNVETTVSQNLTQQKATVENIGSVFDWYGLTIVDSIVKDNFGLYTRQDTLENLKEGQKLKNKLLTEYCDTATPQEKFYVEKLRSRDLQIDQFLNKIYSLKQNQKIDAAIITEMYSLTDPTVELINEILTAKIRFSDNNVQIIEEEIKEFKHFLYCIGVLASVILLPVLFNKNEKKEAIKKIQEIKKRAQREKQMI